MTALAPITNEKLRVTALNRHTIRQGFGVLLSRLESVDSIFHSYTLMQVNFFCQGALVRKRSNNNHNKIYTRKTLCMPQDGHQGVLIVTAKTSPKNQQQKREDVIYSIKTEEKQSPRGQKTLVYGLEDFFVTNLKLFDSRSSTFLEWSNCNIKFYKDAKQNSAQKNNRSKNEIRKTTKIKSKTEID